MFYPLLEERVFTFGTDDRGLRGEREKGCTAGADLSSNALSCPNLDLWLMHIRRMCSSQYIKQSMGCGMSMGHG